MTNYDDNSSIPDGFICLFTQDIMVEPVMLPDGHSYSKEAIETWFARQMARGEPVTSPATNEKLG